MTGLDRQPYGMGAEREGPAAKSPYWGALVLALLLSSAAAQYGAFFGQPSGAWPAATEQLQGAGVAPWGYVADPMAQMDLIGAQLQQQMDQLNQMVEAGMQSNNAELARINAYFIELYRSTTFDRVSSDQVALYYGQQIHCQSYPVDCQLAAQGSAASAANLAASNAAFQRRMADRAASFEAANQAWAAGQAAGDAAHSQWLDAAIKGVDYYGAPGGPAYVLPFAPSQSDFYTTPAGSPLLFDPSGNTWYLIGPDGSRAPLNQLP